MDRKILIKASAKLSLFLALSSLMGGCFMEREHGAGTPDEVIEQYLSALENRDTALMTRLIPKNYISESVVEAKLSQFGGREIEDYEVSFNELKPVFITANLEGRYAADSEEFEDTLTIAYESNRSFISNDGNWYLLLGDGNTPSPDVQPAEP